MRYLIGLVIPLLLQLLAYAIVIFASQGGGSFVGLLALSAMVLAVPALLLYGVLAARGTEPIGQVLLIALAIALLPPILLMVLKAVETSL